MHMLIFSFLLTQRNYSNKLSRISYQRYLGCRVYHGEDDWMRYGCGYGWGINVRVDGSSSNYVVL